MNLYGSQRSVILVIAVVAVMAFAGAGALGPVHIGMMGDSGMHTCPFMQSALCGMDAIGHISEWQSAFVSIMQSFGTAITALLLALSVFVSFGVFALLSVIETPVFSHIRLKRRKVLEASIVSPLIAALSQGILNPKTF